LYLDGIEIQFIKKHQSWSMIELSHTK